MQIDTKLLASIIIILILIILNVFPRISSQWLTQLREAVFEGGIITFLIVMIIQSIVSIIPAEAVLIMGGSAFGFAASSIMGVTGLMAGALINYSIGLIFGKPVVEKIVSASELEKARRLFDKHGAKIIFALRFIPWVSFDAISYFSGIAGISVKAFAIATLFGTIPRALFYSYLGEKIGSDIEGGGVSLLNYILLATLLIIILLIIWPKKPTQERFEEA